jgi:thioredoxin-dependent peroxiredoxin
VLVPGDPAPAFVLFDQDERLVSLDDLRGSWVVLWWYPKASTGG